MCFFLAYETNKNLKMLKISVSNNILQNALIMNSKVSLRLVIVGMGVTLSLSSTNVNGILLSAVHYISHKNRSNRFSCCHFLYDRLFRLFRDLISSCCIKLPRKIPIMLI